MENKAGRRFKKTSTAQKPKKQEGSVFKSNAVTEKYAYVTKISKGIKLGLSKVILGFKKERTI